MPDVDGISEKIQKGLGPYIKSREQVNYIRRILAAHLYECTQGGPIKTALTLANGHDAEGTITLDSTPIDGVYGEYLAALKENVDARKQFEAARRYEMPGRQSGKQPELPANSGLNERVALLRLHQKRDSLYAIQETLDTLLEQPAADPEFLHTSHMFQGSPSLPAVPRDVINVMAIEQSTPALDIPSQVNQLEKAVLRAKLLLKQEELVLQESKQRADRTSQRPSQAAKLVALGATRDELINWIETELSKASPEAQDSQDGEGALGKERSDADPAAIQSKLGTIKEKYATYVSARRALLEMAASRSQAPPPNLKNLKASRPTSYAAAPRPPMDRLVTPYLASLASVSAHHKGMLASKTHMSSLLNRSSQDINRQMEHLAQESPLLSQFPQSGRSRRRSAGYDAAASHKTSISSQVRPWVDASDAAKMATLESVAETVENGQVALEGLMKTLEGIGRISGQDVLGGSEGAAGDEDTWLGGDTPRARRHTRKGSKAQSQSSLDPWSKVRGNLGLLGQDGP